MNNNIKLFSKFCYWKSKYHFKIRYEYGRFLRYSNVYYYFEWEDYYLRFFMRDRDYLTEYTLINVESFLIRYINDQ